MAATLGPRWAARRSLVELRRRSGLVERRSPCLPWDSFESDAAFVGGVVEPGGLLDGGAAWSSPDALTDSRLVFERVGGGSIPVFDVATPVGDWGVDPLTGYRFGSEHWSRVVDGPGVDVKLTWEASRFGWALDLLRVAVLGGERQANELFWSMFDDWMLSNRPNAGVNWRCGQESSIRLVRCLLVAEGLGSLDDRRRQSLCRLADVTARRVLAFIDYAVSQDNNHSISEAMGLIAAASSFPGLSVADESLETGLRVLVDGCSRLVFADGSTSQYSMGYHRVFVEAMLLARLLLERRGVTVPSELVSATDRSVDFLAALVDDDDGSAPLYGEIDGGYLLPLTSCSFTDFRPTVALGCSVVGLPHSLGPGPWNELATWLGFAPSVVDAGPVADRPPSSIQVFRDAGVVSVRAPAGRVTLRAGVHRFRPAQADQLHVDVWLGSHHVALDPGTWSYADRAVGAALKETLAHNTVALPQRGQMPLLSQFLWGDWVAGRVTALDSAAPFVEASHDGYEEFDVSHHRRVEPDGAGWLITDRVTGPSNQPCVVSWLLSGVLDAQPLTTEARGSAMLTMEDEFRFRLTWECDGARSEAQVVDDPADPLTWHCRSYRHRRNGTRLLLRMPGSDFVLRSRLAPAET